MVWFAVLALAIFPAVATVPNAHAATPRLVTATRLGTPGRDDLQDVAIAAAGTIWVVGNTGNPLTDLPKGVKTAVLGSPVESSRFRCGLVASFSADGRKLLSYTQFPKGLVFLTSIALGERGVYIGGYGMPQLNAPMKPLAGLIPEYHKADSLGAGDKNPVIAGWDEDPVELVHLKTKHHGHKGGVPFVALLGSDGRSLEAGTFLEGHMFGWNIRMPLYEQEWTPTGIVVLPGGDLAVCHDGGVPEHYYYAADHVSRLSPDLKERRWKTDVYHPRVDPPEKVARLRPDRAPGWKYPVYGQTRILRMRGDGRGALYIGGWSVSATAKEPWWCPFLWRLDSDGKVVWKAYSHDPMSGSKGDLKALMTDDPNRTPEEWDRIRNGFRLDGLVSDSAIRSMRTMGDGSLLVAGLSDGGNSVLRRHPLDHMKSVQFKNSMGGMRGRELYVGSMMRIDPRDCRFLAGRGFGSHGRRGYEPAWAADVAELPGGRVLAVGRHSLNYPSSPETWFSPTTEAGMFVKVLTRDLDPLFSVNVPDAAPYTAAVRGVRAVVVGTARTERTPVRRALAGEPGGAMDGYLLIADFP